MFSGSVSYIVYFRPLFLLELCHCIVISGVSTWLDDVPLLPIFAKSYSYLVTLNQLLNIVNEREKSNRLYFSTIDYIC